MIAVLTCKRPVDYVNATVRAIEAQGERPLVYADGESDSERVDVQLKKRGQVHAMWTIFRDAAAAKDDLLFFEDDIELSIGAAPYMHGFDVPGDVAFVQFFSTVPARSARACLLRMPLGAMSSMFQAVKFPIRTVLALLRRQPDSDVLWPHMLDAIIPRSTVAVHVPHLVRHVGDVSAIEPGRNPGSYPQSENYLEPPASVDTLASSAEMGRYR